MANGDLIIDPIENLEGETHFRVLLILFLQIGGAAAVFLSRIIYGCPLPHDTTVWSLDIIALLLGALFAGAAYYGAWKGTSSYDALSKFRLNPNPVEINEVVCICCAWLIVIDSVLCAALVLLTGGLFQSLFSPLLLAITGIAFAFRLPRSTLMKTFLVIIVVVGIEEYLYNRFTKFRWDPKFAPGNYHSAVISNIACTTFLTIAAGLESLVRRIPEHVIERTCRHLASFLENEAESKKAVRIGLQNFAADVCRRTTTPTLSEVHDLGAVIEQAMVLNIPYLSYSADVRFAIVYMTFMSHWIDDFYDNLYCEVEEVEYQDRAENIFAKSWHLHRLRKYVRIRLSIDRGFWNFILHPALKRFNLSENYDRWRAMRRAEKTVASDYWCGPDVRGALIDRGLMRIILSGLMQRCEGRVAIKAVVRRCVQDIVGISNFRRDLKEAYQAMIEREEEWIIIWGTAKSVMELFDCCGQEFDVNSVELYTLLYAPLMVFQNLRAEVDKERITKAFKRQVLMAIEMDGVEKVDTEAVGKLLIRCIDLFEGLFGVVRPSKSVDVEARRCQLEATLSLYGEELPRCLKERYAAILKNEQLWGQLASDKQSVTKSCDECVSA